MFKFFTLQNKRIVHKLGRILLLSSVVLFSINLAKNSINIYATDYKVYRKTVYQVNVNDVEPTKTKVNVYRYVTLKSPGLVLLKSNKEYINICPSSGKKEDLADIQRTLKVQDKNGRNISFSVSENGNCLLVKASYLRDIYSGQTYQIKVSYVDKNISLLNGGILELVYPRLQDKPVLTNTQPFGSKNIVSIHDIYIEFVIKSDLLKKLHIYTAGSKLIPKSPQYSFVGDKVKLIYDLNDVWKTGVYLLVGDQRKVQYTINVKSNASADILTKIDKLVGFKEIILPRSDRVNGQEVYYSVLDPEPIDVQISDTGNLEATFAGGKDILVSGYAVITDNGLDIKKLQNIKLSDMNLSPLLLDYVKPSEPYWPSDDVQILQIASNLKKTTLLDTVVADVSYVTDHINYDDNVSLDNLSRKGALKALQSGSGVCMEFADTLITLLRAQGIPSRAVLGNVLTRFVDESYIDVGHQWVEVYFPGYGWVLVDPTLSDKNNIVIGQNLNYFSYFKAGSVKDLTQLKCFTWAKSCNNLDIKVQLVNKLPQSYVQFKQEADLLRIKEQNKTINSYVFVSYLQGFANKVDAVLFANKLPNLNVTTVYIIIFVLLYIIIYILAVFIKWFVKWLYAKYRQIKYAKVANEASRIVSTIEVTVPVTSVDDE